MWIITHNFMILNLDQASWVGIRPKTMDGGEAIIAKIGNDRHIIVTADAVCRPLPDVLKHINLCIRHGERLCDLSPAFNKPTDRPVIETDRPAIEPEGQPA